MIFPFFYRLLGVLGLVFGQLGCELADEEFLKEVLGRPAGYAKEGFFEG
jgi:hypothetical protein